MTLISDGYYGISSIFGNGGCLSVRVFDFYHLPFFVDFVPFTVK